MQNHITEQTTVQQYIYYNNLWLWYQEKGELLQAFRCYQKAQALFEQLKEESEQKNLLDIKA